MILLGEIMRYRKVKRVQYYVPNKYLPPEKFLHYVLLLFHSFRDEKNLLSSFPPIQAAKWKSQNKLQEDGFQNVPNINKIKFEPYGDFVNQDFSQYNQNLVNNQDPNIQIENDETPGGKISQWKWFRRYRNKQNFCSYQF